MPFTLFDNRVDRISVNPRKQAFEKMISGMCQSFTHLLGVAVGSSASDQSKTWAR